MVSAKSKNDFFFFVVVVVVAVVGLYQTLDEKYGSPNYTRKQNY